MANCGVWLVDGGWGGDGSAERGGGVFVGDGSCFYSPQRGLEFMWAIVGLIEEVSVLG